METPLLPIGTRVRIDERSEHFPGALVYIVDTAEDDYAYCVAAKKFRPGVDGCEWVRRGFVHQI